MEQVTLKIKQGIFSVENITREPDREHVYVCFVVLDANKACEWSAGFAAAADLEKIYTSVTDNQVKQAIFAQAKPVLLNALEIKVLNADSIDEQTLYESALQALKASKL